MTDLPAEATTTTTAADAWARDHGCRNINFCCKTPRESFQAGWDAAVAAERELLDRAELVLHGIAIDLIAHKHLLDKPFTDYPSLSPWTRSTGKLAHAAHDLALDIRRHLGLGYRRGLRGLGEPCLTERDIEAQAAADERRAIRQMALDAVGDCPNKTCCLPLFAEMLEPQVTIPREGHPDA
jgi:hypothetical protein